MGENTKIEWADDSVNFWWGCTHDGPGCLHCYAERIAKRVGKDAWGPEAPRYLTKSPGDTLRRLNEKAKRAGVNRLVFINSMSDFFEDHAGPVKHWHGAASGLTLDQVRQVAFTVFGTLTHLTLILLTKRPENVRRMWLDEFRLDNVWLLTSIANQTDYDRNRWHLADCRDLAPVIGYSAEPLLGPIDFGDDFWESANRVDWVIAGGESGPNARPMHPEWPRALRDQCQSAGVAFFFKQWGEWIPDQQECPLVPEGFTTVPSCVEHNGEAWGVFRVGKKAAGRILDGVEWPQFPVAVSAPTPNPESPTPRPS